VTQFERLHPSLQHHIVNTLGWRELRELQTASIEPLIDGAHAILIAPTAGGKTEAAFFPILSRSLTEQWKGLSVIYVCPIKALLNNLEIRLSYYSRLVGYRCMLWHGDVTSAKRSAILNDPPDCLLTTPESLELMLVSGRVREELLFRNLRTVIIDEVHAFAGDDRGWHLIAVLERLQRIAGREVQRIGLSATVGNPEEMLRWMSPGSATNRCVISPEKTSNLKPQVQVDYVGSLENASIVISRLHWGEKRLVFCDSRARVEEVASSLRQQGIDTYVSHSSVSLDERRRAEDAFRNGSDCVIVATSTLELGIDVGDLDRVIQIDAPATVSSFLQRMGRTGRRENTDRNCLFLATSDDSLLQSIAIVQLWEQGYVEPIIPPEKPYQIFAQQLMALALQNGSVGRETWREWLGGISAFSEMPTDIRDAVIEHMLQSHILWTDNGVMTIGDEGEAKWGRRNFMELLSVFTSPPKFEVRHGEAVLGEVHESSFMVKSGKVPVILLGGRNWQLVQLDWNRRRAYVQPADEQGRSRWFGSGRVLSFQLSQAMRAVLESPLANEWCSQRAALALEKAREEFGWLEPGSSFMIGPESKGVLMWWTFAGMLANAAIAERISETTGVSTIPSNLSVKLSGDFGEDKFTDIVRRIGESPPILGAATRVDSAIDGLKFSECLPRDVAELMLRSRLADQDAVLHVLSQPVKFCRVGDGHTIHPG
jgi:ATP-dependent helicase Lhr and Lhr-like helicase